LSERVKLDLLKQILEFTIKKGKIREERINREFKDRISDMDFELFEYC